MYAFFIQVILPIHSWDLNFNSPHCLLFCFLISFELWEFNANEIKKTFPVDIFFPLISFLLENLELL